MIAIRRLVFHPHTTPVRKTLIPCVRYITNNVTNEDTSSTSSSLATNPSNPPAFSTGDLFTSPAELRKRANELIAHRQNVYGQASPDEPWLHKFYRWCDLAGFFSRWNNRMYWGMTSPPFMRLDLIMMTEYERKIHLFRETSIQLFIFTTIFVGMVFFYYRSSRQPLPQIAGLEKPFRAILGFWHSLPLVYPKNRCPSCRPYDPECKKICFEKLRAAGHKLFLDDTRYKAFATPRINLKPPKE